MLPGFIARDISNCYRARGDILQLNKHEHNHSREISIELKYFFAGQVIPEELQLKNV